MKAAVILAVLPLLFISCTKTVQAPATATPTAPPTAQPQVANPAPVSPEPSDWTVDYQPGSERVQRQSDGPSMGLEWKSMGMALPTALGGVHYGLVVSDTPLLDAAGDSLDRMVPAGTRVSVLEEGPWEDTGTGLRRPFRVREATDTLEGWIDGQAVALITAEAGDLAAGIVPRRIVVEGGDAEYNLLAVVRQGMVTLIDTSVFPFPDEFHPSGVLGVSISDVNRNGNLELVVDAETIVSLHYLGTSPLRWVAWLRPRGRTWTPILQYNVSFGTDAGYSYTTTMRAFDSSGVGMLDMVRLDTEYVLVSGENEFRADTVSFYPWSGSTYKKAPLQDLPRRGTVTAETASLFQKPGGEAAAALAKDDLLFVFDRSDKRQAPGDEASWWYRAVTRSGAEGWISGTDVELSWIDPLKENRAVFLGQATPP